MLQFANKPDAAYEICSTIAPNCGGIGDAQFITGSNYATEREPIYSSIDNRPVDTGSSYYATERQLIDIPIQTTSSSSFTLDSDGSRQYGHYGRNRSRNRSELWAAASRDLITERPNWDAANQYAIDSSTDNGKTLRRDIVFHFKVTSLFNNGLAWCLWA